MQGLGSFQQIYSIFISQLIKIHSHCRTLTLLIAMKNKPPQNYQDLCSFAFKLFSFGLTNKQMTDNEPQIKQYRLRQLLEPSWDLVVEQMEAAVSDHLRNLDPKIYQQAKFHFYCTIVSDKRFKFTGINNNSYGQKLTRSFIDACKHFQKEGTFDSFSASEIVKLLKSIYKHYINEYGITEENVPKMDYFTEEEAYKRRSIKPTKSKNIQKKSLNESSESQEVKSRRSTSLLEDERDQDKQALELELKKKQIQRIKIQQEILLQKARMLDLQKEVLAIEKGFGKAKKTQTKPSKSKIAKSTSMQIEHPLQQPASVQRKSILKKKGSVQSKPQPIQKVKPLSKIPAKALARRNPDEDYLDEVYTEVDDDEDFGVQDEEYKIDEEQNSYTVTKEKDKAKVKKSGKRIIPEFKTASKQKQQKNLVKHESKTPTKSAQKSSKQKNESTYLKQEHTTKTKQVSKDVINKKIAPKLTRYEEQRLQKQKNAYQKLKQKTPKKIIEAQKDSKSLIWTKQEELFLLRYLKRSQSSQINISEVLVKKFGKKTRFQNANIRQKKYSIFKACSKQFVNQLRERKLFPNLQIDVIQEYLDNIDWRSSIVFVNEFMVQFYQNNYSRVSNEELRRFVDQMHSLKRKWQKIIPKVQKSNRKMQPQQESSQKINQSVSPIEDEQPLKIESGNNVEEVREQKNPQKAEGNELSFKRKKQLEKVPIPREVIASGKKQMAIRTMNQNSCNQANNTPSVINLQIKKSIKQEQEHDSKHIDLQKAGDTSQAMQANETQLNKAISSGQKEIFMQKSGANLKNIFEEHLSSLGQLKS